MARDSLPIGGLGTIRVDAVGPKKYQAVAYTRDPDGVRRRIKAAGTTKGKAENALKAKHAKRVPPSASDLQPTTKVSIAATKWLAQFERTEAKYQTKRRYRKAVENHIVPLIGALTLAQLTASRAQSFLTTVASPRTFHEQEVGGPVAAKQTKTVLKQIMDMCVRDDAIAHNPVVTAKAPRKKKAAVKAITAQDVRAIREHVTQWGRKPSHGPRRNSPLLLDFLDVLAGTGCRSGEVLALRWEDINLAENELTVTGTLIRADGKLIRQNLPKTDDSLRTITLPSFVVLVLKKRLMRAKAKTGPVFVSRVGGWIEASNMQRIWTSARQKDEDNGLTMDWSHVTFRSYRKAVATIIRKVDGMEAAAAQLGHSSPEITRRHYVEREGRVDFASAVDAFGPVA